VTDGLAFYLVDTTGKRKSTRKITKSSSVAEKTNDTKPCEDFDKVAAVLIAKGRIAVADYRIRLRTSTTRWISSALYTRPGKVKCEIRRLRMYLTETAKNGQQSTLRMTSIDTWQRCDVHVDVMSFLRGTRSVWNAVMDRAARDDRAPRSYLHTYVVSWRPSRSSLSRRNSSQPTSRIRIAFQGKRQYPKWNHWK